MTADQTPPPQRAATAVYHRGAKVVLRIAVHRVLAFVHAHEYVLHDVLRGAPVAEDERGYPQELGTVQPERLIEVHAGVCARFHVNDTNSGRCWLLADSGKYSAVTRAGGPMGGKPATG